MSIVSNEGPFNPGSTKQQFHYLSIRMYCKKSQLRLIVQEKWLRKWDIHGHPSFDASVHVSLCLTAQSQFLEAMACVFVLFSILKMVCWFCTGIRYMYMHGHAVLYVALAWSTCTAEQENFQGERLLTWRQIAKRKTGKKLIVNHNTHRQICLKAFSYIQARANVATNNTN